MVREHSYFEHVDTPMDVGKMLRKLDRHSYQNLGEIATDLEQIVFKYVSRFLGDLSANVYTFCISCRKYNQPGSFPDLEWATPFEKRILDTWSRLVDPKIVSDEKRLIVTWMERTAKSDTGIWFARPGGLCRVFQPVELVD